MNTSLIAESFIINQPADGAAEHLVSIQRDPERAATLPGTRGSVQLRYHSLQLIPVELIDDVPGIWRALLEALEAFLSTGEAEVSYPSLEATILITGNSSLTKFTAGKVRHIVEGDLLIDSILSGAEAYFAFANILDAESLSRIETLRGLATTTAN